MKATFKVKVIDDPTPPVPPFVGTTLTVNIVEARTKFQVTSARLAEGREKITLDWDDGTRQTFESDIRKAGHEFAAPGVYHIRISDDINSLIVGTTDGMAAPLVEIVCNAQRLLTLGAQVFIMCPNLRRADFASSAVESIALRAFKDCTSLNGELFFPNVNSLGGGAISAPFFNCTGGITKIHFSERYRAEIESTRVYNEDPTLGTGSAEVVFD